MKLGRHSLHTHDKIMQAAGLCRQDTQRGYAIPYFGAFSTECIFSTEMRMHDEIMQPVYCRQDTLTGVMELCDSMLRCFHHLVVIGHN